MSALSLSTGYSSALFGSALFGSALDELAALPALSYLAAGLLALAGIMAGFGGRISPGPGQSGPPAGQREAGRKGSEPGQAGPGVLSLGRQWAAQSHARRARKESGEGQLALVCAEVATRLQAGAGMESAWAASLEKLAIPQIRSLPELEQGFAKRAQLPFWHGLRRLLRQPGAESALSALLSATRISTELGAPMAKILQESAAAIAEAGEAATSRAEALAGPKASARLLGVLPLAALGMSLFLGVDPVATLSGGGIGTWSFGLGLAALIGGNLWTYALVRRAESKQSLDRALVLDLAAAALQAGASIPQCLEALAVAWPGKAGEKLRGSGKLLLLGASWEEAFAQAGPLGEVLNQPLQAAWIDGASPVPLLQRAAEAHRAGRRRRWKVAAQKLSVALVLPLGLCLLPAFIALGLLPVIISTLQNLLY